MEKFETEKETRESKVKAILDFGERKELEINTGLNFLNHLIETIAWRSCINIGLKFESARFRLNHVVAEDSGIVLGETFLKAIEGKLPEGIECFGSSYAVLDDSCSLAIVSVEGRANSFIERNSYGSKLENVEDMLSADLAAFLNGFAQGMKCTLRVELQKGEDPHEAWESAFRAVGEALRKCFEKNEWRKGFIAGVKGKLR